MTQRGNNSIHTSQLYKSLVAELHGSQNSLIAVGRRLVSVVANDDGSLNTSSLTAHQFIKRWKSLETSGCSFFGASLRYGCVDIKSNSFSFFEFERTAEQSFHHWLCWMTAGDGGHWAFDCVRKVVADSTAWAGWDDVAEGSEADTEIVGLPDVEQEIKFPETCESVNNIEQCKCKSCEYWLINKPLFYDTETTPKHLIFSPKR